MTDPQSSRPTGTPDEPLLVLTQHDDETDVCVVRGAFRSREEIERHCELYLEGFSPSEGDALVLEEMRGPLAHRDQDLGATSQIVVIKYEGGERRDTPFYVWDSSKKRDAYAPLKLYWCTTSDADEDWFIIERSELDAKLEHADAEGYDRDSVNAEYVMHLPEALQAPGATAVGWPTHEVLVSCGARFLREETPRVVELAGRIFSEGILERLVEDARAGVFRDGN